MSGPYVAFASTEGGCAHYRAELPARLLFEELGWDTAYTVDLEFGSAGGIGIPGQADPDVVILGAGWAMTPPELIALAQEAGQTVLADCDDWPYLPPENPAYNPNAGTHKIASMRATDGVICSTAYMVRGLAEHFDTRRERFELELARNFIDPRWYIDAGVVNRARLHNPYPDAPLKVGFRGLLNGFHDADVRLLAGRLPVDGSVEYVHIGADPRGHSFADLTGVPAELIEERPAQPFGPRYFELLAGIDVGLVPLASRPFSAAKSNIAGLEWLAAGVPIIHVGPHHAEFNLLGGYVNVAPARVGRALEGYRNPRDRAAAWDHGTQRAAANGLILGWEGGGIPPAAGRWARAIERGLEHQRKYGPTPRAAMPATPPEAVEAFLEKYAAK